MSFSNVLPDDEDFFSVPPAALRRRTFTTSIVRNSISHQKPTPPKDDTIFAVKDDENFSVFAKGRDYEPVYVTHEYTEQEKDTLNAYESCDYLPNHCHIFKHWIKRQTISDLETDRWVLMGLIGFVIGVVCFFLHQLIERIDHLKWQQTKSYLEDERLLEGWFFCAGYSVLFAVFAAAIVVFWRPSAGGSGMPEVTGYLNGTQIRRVFSVKTLIVKFFSCVAAIGCGMPIGPEGPMIHMGAIIGSGLSQLSGYLKRIRLPFFERFRNPEDKRNFISAGVAAGVSAAFGAPVGGLLFCMEEVSSFWTKTLAWQIFFCCIIATSTSDIFNSAFERFQIIGMFGEFRTSRYILFNVDEAVDINILMFIPSVIIGIIGGLLGSLFTIINLKIHRLRKRFLASIPRPWVVKFLRLLEPAVIMLIMSSFSIFLPMAFSCIPFTCMKGESGIISQYCVNDTMNKYDSHFVEENIFHTCDVGTYYLDNTTFVYNGTYNELSLLLFSSKDEAMKTLYLRNSHKMFNYGPLFASLIIYFFMVCWSAGTSVAAGILVPMLMIGALYGRIIGLIMVDLFGIHLDNDYLSWMDPGAFALIGSASFFGGVSRLAPAITVIMMELTNDLKVLLPVMTAVMVSKWIGDFFTHPFFHALLEQKCIPFLNQDPHVRIEGLNVKLDLFSAEDIMAFPVVTLEIVDHVPRIAQILLDYQHNGFPVIRKNREGKKVFYGLITRSELLVILQHRNVMTHGRCEPMKDDGVDIDSIDYKKMLRGKRDNEEVNTKFLLQFVAEQSEYAEYYIDLTPYVNQSAMSVQTKFSLKRAYTILSALGLRHLTVVNCDNEVRGMITRKDLMGHHMVEVLTPILHRKSYFRTGSFEKKEEDSDTGGKTEGNKADGNCESAATANVIPTIVVTSPSSKKVTSSVVVELNTLTEDEEQNC
ncbi:chloride channel protein C-like [Physella acuta]|uniref:chloride channel protein C-like n=1 Tax=Physella acuta TaxID=109671 RepID=UPI0027DC1D49|nr:chloride channel protein C-like [Physella acuta]